MLATFKESFRAIDDWIYERIKRKRCRILFVVCDGAGFTSQAPVIEILKNYKDIDTYVTTDKDFPPQDMIFLSDSDCQLFSELYIQRNKALHLKCDMYVNTHLNPFRPKRHGLRLFMDHGAAYGKT